MLSLIEFKVVFLYSINDFILRFLQNLAVLLRKSILRQNINVVDEVDEI